jgi:hypothetical protein
LGHDRRNRYEREASRAQRDPGHHSQGHRASPCQVLENARAGSPGLHQIWYRKRNAERVVDTSKMQLQKPGFRLKSTRRLAEQCAFESFFYFFSS